jgi:uncharacterized protein (DUF697 family)
MAVILEVFVSSPGDLGEERKVAEEVVQEIARTLPRGMSLRARLYEEVVPPALADGGAQDAVNTFMLDPALCDVLVCMLGDRMGTRMKDPHDPAQEYESGTEYELVAAFRSRKQPRPRAIVYYRRNPKPDCNPERRREVELFVGSIVRGERELKGMSPAPFEGPEDLRRKLTEHLRTVVNVVGREYTLRQRRSSALALAALVVAGAGSATAARLLEGRRHERVVADAVTEAVLHAREVGVPQAIRELDVQGCRAAQPLLAKLGQLQAAGDLDDGAAMVNALGRLAAHDTGETCGCPELLSVLAVDNLATRYCMTTHHAVLEAMSRLSCREKRGVLCRYIGKIDVDSSFTSVLCEGEVPVHPSELRVLAVAALGGGAEPCRQGGQAP